MTKKKWIVISVSCCLFFSAVFLWFYFRGSAKPMQVQSVVPDEEMLYYTTLNFAQEPLPVSDHYVRKQLKKVFKVYAYKNLKTYKLHRHASRLFPIMEPILAKYGIPEDFKYVPLVESGLHSGTSHKGASGLWQFMPETARQYGLKVNAAIDERHQVVKSTIAACKYLRRLHKEFGNWTLVAAAYNIGDNKLKKLIDKQNQDSYFSIRFNPETASYVYKLIAMKEIIERPARHGYSKATPAAYAITPQASRYYPDNLLRGSIHTRSQLEEVNY
jgi:membrane-bound lytic murein transglycosylase D